jgi:hypothetical protein
MEGPCRCSGGAASRASIIARERAAWALSGDSQSSVTIDAGGYSTPFGDGDSFREFVVPDFGGRASAHFIHSQYDVIGLNYRDLRK